MHEQLQLFDNPTASATKGRIIGLHGPALSGKDTACQFLQLELAVKDVRVERDAFADRLKVSAARAIGCVGPTSDCIEDMNWLKTNAKIVIFDQDNKIVGGLTGREYLQLYGTEAHRQVFGTDFWVDAVIPNGEPPYYGRDPFDILVVTDVRFDNEAQAIRDSRGEVWRIERPTQINESAHASETPLPDHLIDKTIINDGTLEEFKERVLAAL